MPIASNTQSFCDAAEPSSSRNFGRFSLIFQRASSPKPKSDKLKRPTTAPSSLKKSHRRGLNTGSTSVLSETHHSYAAASSLSIADTYSSHFQTPLGRTNTCTTLPSSLAPPPFANSPLQGGISTPDAMNLLKKARKLSRMFGDLPASMTTDRNVIPDILVFDQSNSPTDSETSPSTLGSTFPKPQLSATNKQVLRRSVTVEHAVEGPSGNDLDVHRSKSFGSLRPSLAIPPASLAPSSESPPISPIEFASRRSGDIGQSQVASSLDDAVPEAIANSQGDHDIHPLPERHSSNPSSPPPSVEHPASDKPSQTTSDEILSNTVHRAASPQSRSSSPTHVPSSSSFQLLTALEQTPRRSSSMRGKMSETPHEPRKRLSLDLLAFKASISPPIPSPSGPPRPATSPDPNEGSSTKRPLKKTRSLWMRKARADPEPELPRPSVEASIPPFSPVRQSFDTSASVAGPLTEKQRLANVRRAKKMTQLFGDQPPTALFQISQFAASTSNLATDEGDSAEADDLEERRRDSLATIMSISSSISTNISNNPNLRLRDSYLSISSVITNSSRSAEAVVTTGSVVVLPETESVASSPLSEHPIEDSDSTILKQPYDIPHDNSTLIPIGFAKSKQHRSPSPRPYTAPAVTIQSSTPTRSYHPPPSPRTPPPFADVCDLIAPSDDWVHLNDNHSIASRHSIDIESSLSPAEFRTRQRRAAKLSQFFGVGMNDLVDVLPANHPSAPKHYRSDEASNYYRHFALAPVPVPSSPIKTSPSETFNTQPVVTARVEVAASKGSRYRFLGGGGDVKELDMSDAIEKLRRMKSV